VRIDHAVLAVANLDEAAARLTAGTGLATIAGGRHPRWGTANRIVPLGADYLELLAVVEPGLGAGTSLGRRLTALSRDGRDRWFSVCLADPDIDRTAARLGLDVETGARTRPDGVEVRWRGAGIEDPSRPDWLPFFIDWEMSGDLHPGRSHADHAVRPTGIAGVAVSGEPAVLKDWLDGARVPIEVTDEGEPHRIHSVRVATEGGDVIVIEGAPPPASS
jgi:Glyoxalase-like domain